MSKRNAIVFVLIILGFVVVCGCPNDKKPVLNTNTILPIERQILAEPNDWKVAYGDTDKTQICFNLAVLRRVLDNQGMAITQLIKDVNDLKMKINDSNDPNRGK